MKYDGAFDAIIVGGSYSGLAAAMALGRALKTVLVIDSGMPCNRQTPYSHNFLTQDGQPPEQIALLARSQVRQYDTVTFFNGMAVNGKNTGDGFEIVVSTGERFIGRKLIFATGIRDILPAIEGVSACWGISVLHCPYCHGYEVRNEKTGVLGNGEPGYELATLISNWTKDLVLFTNGPSSLTIEQEKELAERNIRIINNRIDRVDHMNGVVQNLVIRGEPDVAAKAMYMRAPFEQHCQIPQDLGCDLTEEGYIKVDAFQETTVSGVYACGDNVSRMRTVANAVGMGTTAGMSASRKLIFEAF